MDYRVFRLCDHQRIDILEAYVLARAYDATWRSLYLCEPVGQHTMQALGLAIDFGPSGSRRN
jgi:hypothetical protein